LDLSLKRGNVYVLLCGFFWSNGVLEWWRSEKPKKKGLNFLQFTPILQYSNSPTLHVNK
jgi:hypothetical protein